MSQALLFRVMVLVREDLIVINNLQCHLKDSTFSQVVLSPSMSGCLAGAGTRDLSEEAVVGFEMFEPQVSHLLLLLHCIFQQQEGLDASNLSSRLLEVKFCAILFIRKKGFISKEAVVPRR